MKDFGASKRAGRKRLVRIEQLRATMTQNFEAAQQWFDAHQSRALPGSGGRSFGYTVSRVRKADTGEEWLVRWHNGTLTSCWFPGGNVPRNRAVIATTLWNDNDSDKVWTKSRPMRCADVKFLHGNVEEGASAYWAASNELDTMNPPEVNPPVGSISGNSTPAKPSGVKQPTLETFFSFDVSPNGRLTEWHQTPDGEFFNISHEPWEM